MFFISFLSVERDEFDPHCTLHTTPLAAVQAELVNLQSSLPSELSDGFA
jgi:hypothetical protein